MWSHQGAKHAHFDKKMTPNNSVLPIIAQEIAWKHKKQPKIYNEDEAR